MHRIVKAFSQLYPTVWKYILLSKRKDYTALAAKLMQTESKLMNKAVTVLCKRYPGEVFLRLHDAIITSEAMSEIAKKAIEEISMGLIGVIPKLSINQFNKEEGQIADHDLSFEELSTKFRSDQCEDLEMFYDSITKAIYRKDIDFFAYLRRI